MYWTPEKIKDALKREPYQFYIPLENLAGFAFNAIKERQNNAKSLSDLIEPIKTAISTELYRLNINSPGQFPAVDLMSSDDYVKTKAYKHMTDVATTYCMSSAIYLNMSNGAERFFIEPTIAEALATAKNNKLAYCDIPAIDKTVVIYWPKTVKHKIPGAYNKDLIQVLELVYCPQYYKSTNPSLYSAILTMHVKAPRGPYLHKKDKGLFNFANLTDKTYVTADDARAFTNGWPGSYIRGLEILHQPMRSIIIDNPLVRTIVNMLLYWKSEDPDIIRRINPNFEKTRKKKKRKKDKRQKTNKKLPSGTGHFIVGQNLEIIQRRKSAFVPTDPAEKSDGKGKAKAYHQTRGHWRWQVHGKGRQKRKLIFIETFWSGKAPPKEKVYSVRS